MSVYVPWIETYKTISNENTSKENSSSYDYVNRNVVLNFHDVNITIPFSLIKQFYKDIIKAEEVGLTKNE